MSEIQAYPLQWPVGWRRTSAAERASGKFNSKERKYATAPDGSSKSWHESKDLTVAQAVERVLRELESFGVHESDIVISTNVRPTLSGVPRSGEKAPDDPGVAVYWQKRGQKQRCMAIDRYTKVADNLAAVAATLNAMRAIERHGGAEILDRAFTGFAALPAPEQPWQVLGVGANATRDEIDEAYRRLAMEHHPDRGGDPQQMARINAARDDLYERLRPT
jgi:DnaJ domain